MTSSIRSRLSRSPGSGAPGPRRYQDPEERFTRFVTIGFVGIIVAVVAIVVVALIYDYWVQHFKAVATVNGAGITRDQWFDRYRLEYTRLDQEENRVRAAIAAGDLTAEQGNARIQAIAADKQDALSTSIEDLIDLTFKGQLAQERALAVSEDEISAAATADATSPGSRRLSVIFVEPDSDLPVPGLEARQAAYRAAHEAAEKLASGTPFEEVARTYSTDASKDDGGDYGLVNEDSDLDPVFLTAVLALEEGQTTPVIKGDDGVYRIGRVTEVKPGVLSTGFEQAIRDSIGQDKYRQNLRMEVLAQKLEDAVVAEAVGGDVEQAHLAEILLEGDTEVVPDEDEGTIHAAHILYSPGDDPQGATSLPEDDPAWVAAEEEAQRAATQLRSIDDVEARITAFGERARAQSDDTVSGANGGELGFFARADMVPEFADPLFDDTSLQRGDLIGPVKSSFGYHVILFFERTPGLQARLDAVTQRLDAPDADFAAIATDLSEGDEGAAGGDLGWLTRSQLPEEAADVAFALEPGAVSEPVALDDGYHLYRLIEKATRPLDVLQRATVVSTAFDDWYQPQKSTAEDEDRITRDPEIFDATAPV
jgi:parvulin-like peptidyl-prolyl isomerase